MSAPTAGGRLPRISDPSPGTEFLRILSRPSGAAWRLVVAALACLAGLIVLPLLVLGIVQVIAIVAGTGYRFDLTDGVDAIDMLTLNLGLAGLIGLAALVGWLLYGVRPRWLSSVRPGLRWRWLLMCAGMAVVVWALLFVAGTASAVASRDGPMTVGAWAFIAVVLLTTPLQAAGEEYVFRGLLLQALGALRWPSAVCCVLSGLLFAVAHLQFDPQLFADRVLLGIAFAVLAVKTGGLEAGIAIHAVKNVAVLIPTGLVGNVDAALDPQGVSWVPLVVDAVLLAIVVPWVLAAARRRTTAVVAMKEPAVGASAG